MAMDIPFRLTMTIGAWPAEPGATHLAVIAGWPTCLAVVAGVSPPIQYVEAETLPASVLTPEPAVASPSTNGKIAYGEQGRTSALRCPLCALIIGEAWRSTHPNDDPTPKLSLVVPATLMRHRADEGVAVLVTAAADHVV